MKGEESNAEKRHRDERERATDRGYERRSRYDDYTKSVSQRRDPPPPPRQTSPIRGNLTPLNQRRATILKEVLHTRRIPELNPARKLLGRDTGAWCEYHRGRGHDTDNCYALKNEIEKLIRRGLLKQYVKVIRPRP